MLATGDETKQFLVRVERVGRICLGQFLETVPGPGLGALLLSSSTSRPFCF